VVVFYKHGTTLKSLKKLGFSGIVFTRTKDRDMSILSHPDESAEEFCPLKVVDYFAVANHEAHWTVVFMKVATIDPSHHLGMGQCVCEGRISWRGTVNDTKSVVFVIEAERRDTGGLIPVYTAGFNDLHP
jgi:hypothetical protein